MTDKTLKERVEGLSKRLKGIYTVDANDGAGVLNGSDKFTRTFPVPPINHEVEQLIQDQQARIEELEKQQEWQPIDIAPKDGTHILLCLKDGALVEGWYEGEEWESVLLYKGCGFCGGGYEYINPTHWKPLDQPPKESE